jgi:hypothetical protein
MNLVDKYPVIVPTTVEHPNITQIAQSFVSGLIANSTQKIKMKNAPNINPAINTVGLRALRPKKHSNKPTTIKIAQKIILLSLMKPQIFETETSGQACLVVRLTI